MQVNAKAGLTFATGLRSMLRADPDVIMVGEIRDRETAQIAVEAALTGHLVLSTLHTNDAPTAVTRLVEMGIEPFLVASVDRVHRGPAAGAHALQRLPGRDRASRRPTLLETRLHRARESIAAYEAVGCRRCGGTGYKGRIGLYETMHDHR